ncbi:hypothetical protein [Secundilactobacillus odoratitofui]|uniref:hypothetical protein n=1 Tax=Secundilactobacillus odoratitofui TaxID=480930 RepID=UPI0020936008|nr:hypothetical protein [Secundilactobacillus odoratitofui]
MTEKLTSQDYMIMPVLYNGEDVNQAMSKQKAPQNTAHDYAISVHFENNGTAELTHLGQVRQMTKPTKFRRRRFRLARTKSHTVLVINRYHFLLGRVLTLKVEKLLIN